MKIGILGYGKMGKEVEKIAIAQQHEIVWKINSSNRTALSIAEIQKADVVIEFTSPESVLANLQLCFEAKVPVVTGSTGWYEQLDNVKKMCVEQDSSLFYASNFSIGVHLFFQINRYAAHLFNQYKEYNVSIEEIHHTQKKDAPSGTAITTAEVLMSALDQKNNWSLDEEKNENSIAIKAHRIENVPGTHEVDFSSAIDTIKIEHIAHNRQGFATGAVKAAEWILHKKGVFTMQDMLANPTI